VALFLQEHGYRASALLGGYDAWVKAGFPLETQIETRLEAQIEPRP
jgi:rhodanese-related sulfurtransferase